MAIRYRFSVWSRENLVCHYAVRSAIRRRMRCIRSIRYDKKIFLLLADDNWHCGKLLLTHQWAELLWASSWRRPSSPQALMEALLWILANQWRYIRLPPEWRWTTNTSAAVVNGRLKQRNSVLEPECNKSPGYILSLIRNAHCMAFANMKDWKNTFTLVGEAVGSFCSESPQRPQP